jgi:hypothetical protein
VSPTAGSVIARSVTAGAVARGSGQRSSVGTGETETPGKRWAERSALGRAAAQWHAVAFEGVAIPAAQISGRLLRSLQELQLWLFFFAGLAIPAFYAVGLLAGSDTPVSVADFWRFWVVRVLLGGRSDPANVFDRGGVGVPATGIAPNLR